MSISVKRIPSANVFHMVDTGPQRLDVLDIFKGKRHVLFGLPGAFTPVCSSQQVPSFIAAAPKLKEQGIDKIICLSVNDPFVMHHWAKTFSGHESLFFLADAFGELTHKLGLEDDLSRVGLGKRSLRYSCLVDDGLITLMDLEPNSTVCTLSHGNTFLKHLESFLSTKKKG